MAIPPTVDSRLLEALQRASSLELFQLSTVLDRLLADLAAHPRDSQAVASRPDSAVSESRSRKISEERIVALNDRKLVLNELAGRPTSLPGTRRSCR
ncbi:MAG: hypothetical protein R3E83_20965 [Burkholderiaceae bacterium]